MITTIDVSHTHLFSFLSLSPPGQGLLSQSALQLNNQDAYAAAGYHSNQGLALGESVMGRSGQAGGAVHIYNQVQYSALCFFFISILSSSTSLAHFSLSPPLCFFTLHLIIHSFSRLCLRTFLCSLSCFSSSLPSSSVISMHPLLPLICFLTSCLPLFSHLSPHCDPSR